MESPFEGFTSHLAQKRNSRFVTKRWIQNQDTGRERELGGEKDENLMRNTEQSLWL